MAQQQTVSIVIPCYNERDNVERTYRILSEEMKSCRHPYEFVFVDNGGTDGQVDIMTALHAGDPDHMRIVSLSRNFGYQMCISAGLEHTSGDAVIIIDADLQDPPAMIKEFIAKWHEGYDVVYGIRKKRRGPLYMRVFYKFFYWLLNTTADVDIPMNAGDYGLMTRQVVDHIVAMPENIRFVRGMRAWVGFKQFGIPYVREIRKKGSTKFRFLDSIALALDGILSFSTRILTLVIVLGFAVALISMVLLVYIVIWKFTSNTKIPGYAAIMVSVSFFSGIILFIMGIMGTYVERIFVEVKARPKFIVKGTSPASLQKSRSVARR